MLQFIKTTTLTIILLTLHSTATAQTIDIDSGLRINKGYQAVKAHCSSCHSLKLVRQNKASRQGWLDMIRWMQNTQGMAQLNQQLENTILSYLAKNYAPNNKSRRTPLVIDKWRKY